MYAESLKAQEAMIIGRVQGDPKNCAIECVCLGDKSDDKSDDKPGDDTVK